MDTHMKPGDQIIWATDLDKPQSLRHGTVVKVSGEYLQYGPKVEDSVHVGFVFPARVESDLVAIITKRQRLRKAYDDSMKLIYELRNAVTRGDK